MSSFIQRHPGWSLVILLLAVSLLWLIIAPWPAGFEAVFGRKRIFLNACSTASRWARCISSWPAASPSSSA
jgi:hypothetical protein